jgi:hypothetical protein
MTRSETIPMTRLRISEAEDSEDDDAKESDNEQQQLHASVSYSRGVAFIPISVNRPLRRCAYRPIKGTYYCCF